MSKKVQIATGKKGGKVAGYHMKDGKMKAVYVGKDEPGAGGGSSGDDKPKGKRSKEEILKGRIGKTLHMTDWAKYSLGDVGNKLGREKMEAVQKKAEELASADPHGDGHISTSQVDAAVMSMGIMGGDIKAGPKLEVGKVSAKWSPKRGGPSAVKDREDEPGETFKDEPEGGRERHLADRGTKKPKAGSTREKLKAERDSALEAAEADYGEGLLDGEGYEERQGEIREKYRAEVKALKSARELVDQGTKKGGKSEEEDDGRPLNTGDKDDGFESDEDRTAAETDRRREAEPRGERRTKEPKTSEAGKALGHNGRWDALVHMSNAQADKISNEMGLKGPGRKALKKLIGELPQGTTPRETIRKLDSLIHAHAPDSTKKLAKVVPPDMPWLNASTAWMSGASEDELRHRLEEAEQSKVHWEAAAKKDKDNMLGPRWEKAVKEDSRAIEAFSKTLEHRFGGGSRKKAETASKESKSSSGAGITRKEAHDTLHEHFSSGGTRKEALKKVLDHFGGDAKKARKFVRKVHSTVMTKSLSSSDPKSWAKTVLGE